MLIKTKPEEGSIEPILETLFQNQPLRLTLSNGLTVILKEDHSAELASLQLWVKTGSIHEDRLLSTGASHYVEHMLFKGTEKRSYKDISETIHQTGGSVNAYTTFDRTVYYIDTISESTETALDILSDIAFHSVFDPSETQSEQSVILREIDMGLDDPDQQVDQALLCESFKKHPYRYPIIGVRESFLSLTRDDLYTYYKERYIPNNMVLVISGDFDTASMLASIQQYFGSYTYTRIQDIYIQEEPAQMALREHRIYGDYNVVRGSMAFSIPGLTDEDTPSLSVLASMLAQGKSSILWQSLREQSGLVFDISASAWNPGTQGLFWLSYTCEPGKREAAESTILAEIQKASQGGITEALLQKARRSAEMAQINACKTVSSQASLLGAAEVVAGDIHYPKTYLKQLGRVTLDDVNRVLLQYLQPERLTTASSEPEASKASKAPSISKKTKLAPFSVKTLDNGVRILLQPTEHFPKVAIKTCLKGGPLFETENNSGITSLLSTLLTKDTKNRTSLEVSQTLETIGASFSEYAGNNSFGLGVETLTQDIPTAVDILKEGLCAPAMWQEGIDTERAAQIAQIEENLDDIRAYGRYKLREQFFGNHPFRRGPLGDIDSLQKITQEDIRAHYRQLVTGPNLVISVSGQFDEEQMAESLTQAFQDLSAAPLAEAKNTFESPHSPGLQTLSLDREQAVVFQGYKDCGITSQYFETAELLDELFSGLSSHLFTRVREEQGLAYYVGSTRIIGMDMGMFLFSGGTHPDKAEAVLKEIDLEVTRITEGRLHAGELDRAKTRLKADKRMALQTPGSRATDAALNTLYGLPTNHWQDYSKRLDAITEKDIQDYAKTFLLPADATRLIVSPKS